MEGAGGCEGIWTLCMVIPVYNFEGYTLNSVRTKLKIKLRWNNRCVPEGLVEAFGRWVSNAEVLPSTILTWKAEC